MLEHSQAARGGGTGPAEEALITRKQLVAMLLTSLRLLLLARRLSAGVCLRPANTTTHSHAWREQSIRVISAAQQKAAKGRLTLGRHCAVWQQQRVLAQRVVVL